MEESRRRNPRASVLGLKKLPGSVQLLDTRLKSYDPEVRRQAYVNIFKLEAPEEPTVDKAVELLDHENWYVREAGSKALAHCTDAGFAVCAANVVQERLDDEDPDVRRRAANALVELVERANDPCRDKSGAAEAAEIAAASLASRLEHTDARVRQNALIALSKMGAQATPHAVALCTLVVDPDLSIRNEVVRMVARLGAVIVQGVSALAQGLGHEDEPVRRSAKRALLALSKVCGAQVALATSGMLKNENAVTRIATLDCLADLGQLCGKHVQQMAELLEEMRQEVRLSAVRAIISVGSAARPGLKEIRRRLTHENCDVRRAAVQTLRGLASMCPSIPKVCAKDLEELESTRLQSLEILGGAAHLINGDKKYLYEIVHSLEDQDWLIRRAAIETLHDLQEHAAPIRMELGKRLVHSDAFVRRAAAEAVGRMGIHAGEIGHRLQGCLTGEEDIDVRQTLEEACQMLHAVGMA